MDIRPSLLRHLQRVRLRPGPLRLRRRRRRRRLRPRLGVRRHGRLLGIARSARIGGKFKIEFFLLLSLSLPNVFFHGHHYMGESSSHLSAAICERQVDWSVGLTLKCCTRMEDGRMLLNDDGPLKMLCPLTSLKLVNSTVGMHIYRKGL